LASLSLSSLSVSAQTAARDKTVVPAPVPATSAAYGPTVRDIEIIFVGGPKSVSRQVILANMRTTIGQPYTPAGVQEDIRNLYATGLFVNLRISDEPLADGIKVIVIVQPKPLVKEIVLNGYKLMGEKRLRKEVKSKPGDPLSEQQVSTDADKIRELYQNKGFNKATVTYKIDVNEAYGRAVVTFNITEGERGYVTSIKFVGNKALTEKELQKQMKTRRKNWLSFINKSGLYKEDQFKDDLKKVREYYQSKGYIDIAIKDTKFEYPQPGEMTVVITVFEGIQYKVGKIAIEGNTLFPTDVIRKKLVMVEPGVYSPQGLEKDIKAVTDLYGEKGYIDAQIRPERQANVESGKIDLLYVLTEGPQSYVEKIVIQGNNKTKDKVLRRELALAPGEIYDSVSADASKRRLENLGYFNKVDISPQDTSVPNRKNMVVTVEEKRTGSITFGAGFSSVDSLLGFVELSQGNFDISNFPYFTGAGQKFRTRLQYGLKRKDFVLSFTEPWFLNQRLSLGFDLFARDANYQSSRYDQMNYGGAVRLARALNQFWTVSLKYQLENINIYNVETNVYELLIPGYQDPFRQEKGWRSKSSVQVGLTYDTRDNVFLTRKGEKIEFTGEVAGGPLQGQTDIWKVQMDAQKWFALPHDLILSLNLSTGVGDSYDSTKRVPIFDRYFVGGSRSVRGFDNRDIGPHDPVTGEPLGGKTFGYANVELTFPIIDRVRGAVFADYGFVDPDTFNYTRVFDSDYAGAGIGMGLRLNLPIGPLRLDFGIPLKDNTFNSTSGKFHFDVGYQF
jgi:outer membrane protein insertion porin family